jgi:class 3 adenylate cyclase
VAARLHSVAAPGQVVIGDATYRALSGYGQVTQLGAIAVIGRRQPVTAYVLRALRFDDPPATTAVPPDQTN